MAVVDYVIVVVFFAVSLGAGVFFSKRSGKSAKAYFLGNNENKWWMLAASGASSNFSISGTIWNLAILMVLGMKSFWVTLVWWMPNAVFLMSYSGIWIRRCGATTAAELNRVRFGVGRGAQWARTSFAVMITLFSIASLCMSYIIIHKFALVFGHDPRSTAHIVASAVIGLTAVYVLFGGFKGVIWTDFLQTVLLFVISAVIGCICFSQYDAGTLHGAIAGGGGDEALTASYWKSLAPAAYPRLGIFENSTYTAWKDFTGATLAFSVVGIIGCIGGAGGRYGEQRFLATRNTKEAAKLAALWQFLGFPRWVMTAGLAFLGFVLYRKTAGADPETVLPLFLQSGLLKPGVMGLVVAGLTAAYMSTFSSEINACASIVIKDIFQPIFRPHEPEESHLFVGASYVATAFLAVISIALGWFFVESQSGGQVSALNVIWSWMLGGLLTCFVIPQALRWYWGRMNGWGFAWGCLAPLVPSLAMLVRSFVGEGHFLHFLPVNVYTYITLAVSLGASVAGSLLSRPLDDDVTLGFYCKVRPFGLWGPACRKAREAGMQMATALSFPIVCVNVVLGLVASFSLFMAPVFFLGHWIFEGAVCSGTFAVSCCALYFTWYRTLPED